MTQDEKSDAMDRVAEFARSLGLSGVMILSPRCAKCGNCHDWGMVADAVQPDDPDQSVRDLLLHWADLAVAQKPVLVPMANPRTRQ